MITGNGFVKAQPHNLPKINTSMMASNIASNPDLVKGVKAKGLDNGLKLKITESDEDQALSREERIRRYWVQKELEKRRHPRIGIHKSFPLSQRLEKRAEQRFLKKLTPEQKQYVRWRGKSEYIRIPRQMSDYFTPTNKLKDNTVIGPLDGKGSWNTDYYPSIIDTTAGKFCPAMIADKDQISKEKVAKEQKYEDKVRREKYTTGPSIDLRYEPKVYGADIYMRKPKIFEKEVKHTEKEKEKTFEEKLCDTIRSLDIKSSDRTATLTALQAALCRRLSPDVVKNNYTIITEALEKIIRKGRRAEQIAAAKVVPILFVQLGEDHCEKLLNVLRTPLLDNIMDDTINTSVRAECCQSLAIISFLSNNANDVIMQLMKICEKIFSGKYEKDDNSVKVDTIRVIALDAWSLLLSRYSPAEVRVLLGKTATAFCLFLSNLAQLLKAPSAELQKSAGIALSLVYEMGLEFSEKFGQDELTTIVMDVKQLAKEPSRFKSKEDRKTQRALFRDILKFLEEGVTPVERVYVGDERIELDQWNLHVRYHRLATALGSGLQISFGTSLLQSALLMGHLQNRKTQCKDCVKKDDQNTSEDKPRNVSTVKKLHPSASEIKARSISRAKARNKNLAAIYY